MKETSYPGRVYVFASITCIGLLTFLQEIKTEKAFYELVTFLEDSINLLLKCCEHFYSSIECI